MKRLLVGKPIERSQQTWAASDNAGAAYGRDTAASDRQRAHADSQNYIGSNAAAGQVKRNA